MAGFSSYTNFQTITTAKLLIPKGKSGAVTPADKN
jgi:hypothetical protein